MKEYVLISDLAKQLRTDRSYFLKWLKKNDFGKYLHDVRTKESRGQATKAVAPEVARKIVEERRRQGWEC